MPLLLSLVANKRIIGVLLAIGLCFYAGWYVRGVSDESALEFALKDQESKLIGQCNDDKKSVMETNDGLQSKISLINKHVADSKRLQPVCASVIRGVADDPAGGRGYADQNGISAGWLREYAAECEVYRVEVITLDEFGRKHYGGE